MNSAHLAHLAVLEPLATSGALVADHVGLVLQAYFASVDLLPLAISALCACLAHKTQATMFFIGATDPPHFPHQYEIVQLEAELIQCTL